MKKVRKIEYLKELYNLSLTQPAYANALCLIAEELGNSVTTNVDEAYGYLQEHSKEKGNSEMKVVQFFNDNRDIT